MSARAFTIGIVSGKLGGVDGVSLEVDKWISVLQGLGHKIVTVAGSYVQELETVAAQDQFLLKPIAFDDTFQHETERIAFPFMPGSLGSVPQDETNRLGDEIEVRGREVGRALHELVKDTGIDVLVGQNTNAMPMTILGGVAMHYVATEQRVATVFHHHDFWWERSRFSNSRIEPLLNRIMPPVDLGLEHVVISSYAAHILSSLKRVRPHIVPNCEDFDDPPALDDYNRTFRDEFGFSEDDVLIVQPTRIVPRKRIEDSVSVIAAFVERFPEYRGRARLVISLYQGDEPDQRYVERIRDRADELGVPLHFISDRVRSVRTTDESGRRCFTNRDVLVNADLVTYLPAWEGFGNALLEAIAARVPVVVTTYLVYKTDIMACGLRNIEMRDSYDDDGNLIIFESALDRMHKLLSDADERRAIVDHNFDVARREFGMERLARELACVFDEYGHEVLASRKRIEKSRVRYSV